MSLHDLPELDRLDALLMRVLDGEADLDEREELMALADSDVRLAEQFELRHALREALVEDLPAIEIVGAVLAALAIDDSWDAIADGLRADIAAEASAAPIDLSDAIMAEVVPGADREAMLLSALFDGEASAEDRAAFAARADRAALREMNAHAALGSQIRDAVSAATGGADLSKIWGSVAKEIGLPDGETVPGWEPIGLAIREAVTEWSELSPAQASALTDRVMEGLPTPAPEEVLQLEPEAPELEQGWQRWVSALFGPVAVLAMALLLFMPGAFNIAPKSDAPAPSAPAIEEIAALTPDAPEPEATLEISTGNHAEVESLEYADDVIVQVFQQEDDAPLFVWIDEPVDEGATL